MSSRLNREGQIDKMKYVHYMILLIFHLFLPYPSQECLRDIGGGHGAYALDGNHQAAVFLDPADDTFRPLELPVDHPNTLAPVELGVVFTEIFHSLLADEVTSMKMFISRSGMARGSFLNPFCLVYRITLSRELPLYLQGTADSGTEEHERADNRTADFPLHAVAFHQGFLTRNVSLQLVFSQHVLDLENFVIKYFQGEPMLNGMCFYVQRKAMLPGL